MNRTLVKVDFSIKDYNEIQYVLAPEEEANCWCSIIDGTEDTIYDGENQMHLPCFDVDVDWKAPFGDSQTPAREWVNHLFRRGDVTWVASTTPGHHHAMIDAPYTWDEYIENLVTLSELGIVEIGYVNSADCRCSTMVRLPHIKKEYPAPDYQFGGYIPGHGDY